MTHSTLPLSSQPVIVAGGGIGGLAAALALVRQGFAVKVLEQAPSIGEIGAGIQLGRTRSPPLTRWASASGRAAGRSTPTKWS